MTGSAPSSIASCGFSIKRDAPGEEALLGLGRQRRERGEALRRRQVEPGRVERRFARRQQPVGRRAGQIVERAAQRRLGRPQIERAVAIAAVDQIAAQRIEREIERDREIAGQIRPRDLQPVGLEIVDMPLAEAALPCGSAAPGSSRGRAGRTSPWSACGDRGTSHRPRRRPVRRRHVRRYRQRQRARRVRSGPDGSGSSPSSPIVTITPARLRSASL